ncbi:Cox20p [Sugiyamaella lignohabitans]|uniref:Cytochrome c oxidase assembly protein COX20, mitochondrial n=1 Tax=Sugiyamaella lignohabitans TaxID=796027 RepID=A0A167DL29_9ASCO|nr:Cox20p [Sugiyamaella lignohabitans]ANB13030.1 Cox20p [Sugiyamaella lignohabitans]
MWGFGWLSRKSEKPPVSTEKASSVSPEKELLLEDLPPKFEDKVEERQKRPKLDVSKPDIFQKAVSSISTDDFKNVHTIPCFRQGMLAGLGVGGVIFAVLISTRSSISRSMNWGMGGFVAGSVVSWEQCRAKMRQSRRNAQAVKESLRRPRSGLTSGPGSGPSQGEGEAK